MPAMELDIKISHDIYDIICLHINVNIFFPFKNKLEILKTTKSRMEMFCILMGGS